LSFFFLIHFLIFHFFWLSLLLCSRFSFFLSFVFFRLLFSSELNRLIYFGGGFFLPTADVCDNPQPADSLPKVVTKANTTKAKLPEEDPLLSPASDLRVTRKVGQDGLVIAWLPSTDSQCVGYLICVNGQESQRVRSAQRTKAVLCGLNLHEDMEICIYSLSADMLISRAERAFYSPDSEEPSALQDTAVPGSGPTKGPVPEPTDAITPAPPPREVVVQTFYTNSSVTVRSSRRVTAAATATSRIPVRSCVP